MAGRREENKRATKAALHEAAARLFAEQGYEDTTVAQIAEVAQVGVRTFYRYYDGKEDLLAEHGLAWLDVLHDAIRDRPPDEEPYLATTHAVTAVVGQLDSETSWLDQPRPMGPLRRDGVRPMRRLERAIASAVQPRIGGGPDAEFQAQLLARVTVAALRTAMARHRALAEASPGVESLLRDTFSRLADLVVSEV